MGVISRGIKNAFRNGIRTTSIVFILAVSISMALIMLMSLKTVQAKITSVKSSIGNTITVSPAGIRGFEGGGTLLTSQNATDVASLAHVTSTTVSLNDRLRNENSSANQGGPGGNNNSSVDNTTNLTSPITPGSFGNRQRASQGESTSTTSNATFSMPITVTGVNDLDSAAALSAISASQFNVTSGTKIDPTSSSNVAMIGKDLATKNNLSVGQTFTAYGQNITVTGIFDTGNTFSNAGIIMPIKTVQTLSGQTDQINSIIALADSIDNVSSVQSAIKDKLGSDKVDVTSQQDTSNNAIAPLENIKTISLYSLIGSLVAGAVIIFLTMLMIVRERTKEIGVLKAIGSSNVGIMSQFIVESLVLTLTSSVIGIIAGIALSNPVLKVLVTNSQASASTTQGFGGGGGGRAMMANFIPGARNTISNIHAVVGWDIILYGLLAAIVIAIIGSAIPAFFIAKIRPAEVMRTD